MKAKLFELGMDSGTTDAQNLTLVSFRVHPRMFYTFNPSRALLQPSHPTQICQFLSLCIQRLYFTLHVLANIA